MLSRFYLAKAMLLSVCVFVLSGCGGSSSDGFSSEVFESFVTNADLRLELPDQIQVSSLGSGDVPILLTNGQRPATVSTNVISAPQGGDISLQYSPATGNLSVIAVVPGEYRVEIEANTASGTARKSLIIEVLDGVVVPDIRISPAQPDIRSYLYAEHADVAGPNGLPLRSIYRWQRNEAAYTQSTAKAITNRPFARGDTVSVALEVSDGVNIWVGEQSDAVTIGNAAPSFELRLSVVEPKRDDTVTVSVINAQDIDNDEISYSYQWYLNNQSLADQTSASLTLYDAVANDSVHVEVTGNDGYSDTTVVAELLVGDTPSVISVSQLPERFKTGERQSFTASFVDPDGTAVSTQLIAGPDNLSYSDDGLVSWTPPSTLLTATTTFKATFKSSDDQTATVAMTVVDDQFKPPLARSGMGVPRQPDNVLVDDFDNDGKSEILTNTSGDRLFTLELNNGSLQQDWLYPFATSDWILHVAPLDNSGEKMLVATKSGIDLIDSRITAPRTMYQTSANAEAATYGDFDRDGDGDVAFLLENRTVEIVDTGTWQLVYTVDSATRDRQARAITSGNVDDDSALEIITGNGEVIDGKTGAIEWQHHTTFGVGIAVGDIDDDGLAEFVAGDRYNALKRFDARTQTATEFSSATSLEDICGPLLLNADEDIQLELATGGCQAKNIHIWDIGGDTLTLKENQSHNVFGDSWFLSAGDIDDDGFPELIWTNGLGSTARDKLMAGPIGSLGDSTPVEIISDVSSPALFGFSVAGEFVTDESDRVAVFTVDNAKIDASDKQRLITLSEDNEFRLSEATGRSVYDKSAGLLVDTDRDGDKDLVHIDYDGNLRYVDLENFEELYSYDEFPGEYSPVFLNLSSPVTLADGTEAVLLSDSRSTVQLYDIVNRANLWTSKDHSSINQVLVMGQGARQRVVVADHDQITTWNRTAQGYEKIHATNLNCDLLESMKVNGEDTLLCIRNAGNDNSTLLVFNSDLTLAYSSRKEQAFDVIEVVSGDSSDRLLLGSHDGYIVMIDAASLIEIWRSPKLIGAITSIYYSLQQETARPVISIGTTRAAYISR